MGRPFSENPKEIRLTVRLDKRHNDILERYAAKHKVTRNEAMRRGIEKLDDHA
ncbi:CopG family transcriptional regulator [Paenibacillus oralis]|uniref:CopG family transcriptional regulator n=1 Tax=Paenibacillus oralis TaxID=2490856 RepID=A0A3P3UDM1_9BACL|nr:CopG family transcriptional regulator [Paenibacillus oralis]